jgi:hypothetical protein
MIRHGVDYDDGHQGVKASSMFRIGESGKLEAILHNLDVPVR